MLDQDVKIVRQTEDGTFEPGTGRRIVEIRVEFMLGTHGPFSVRVPKEGFTQYNRDEAVMKLARELRVQ